MTLPELIEKHRINSSYLAEKMGMSRGDFNNKLKGNGGRKFSAAELLRLLEILSEMQKDIRNFINEV